MNSKTIVLLILAVLAFLTGALGQYIAPGQPYPPTEMAFILAGSALVFAWYLIDTQQRSYKRTVWLNIGVVGLALVALPYYFFRSRGAKSGLVATGLFLLMLLASFAFTSAGQYAIYYGLQS